MIYKVYRSSPPQVFLEKVFLKKGQQIYKKTHMPKCDFNKFALQLYWNYTSAWVFSCKFAAYFQNTFYTEHLWTAASNLGTLHFYDFILKATKPMRS